MPHFAYCPDGIVERVERIEAAVMLDGKGKEKEELGQAFLAELYPGTDPAHYVLTHYPNSQVDPYPRGQYAAVGDLWDGSRFATPRGGTDGP
jgi:hypothetical protein